MEHEILRRIIWTKDERKSLKDIYSDPTVYVATPLSEDSTIKVLREASNDVDTPYYRHNGSTIRI